MVTICIKPERMVKHNTNVVIHVIVKKEETQDYTIRVLKTTNNKR